MSEDYFAKKWSEGDIVFLSVIGFGILVLFAVSSSPDKDLLRIE